MPDAKMWKIHVNHLEEEANYCFVFPHFLLSHCSGLSFRTQLFWDKKTCNTKAHQYKRLNSLKLKPFLRGKNAHFLLKGAYQRST